MKVGCLTSLLVDLDSRLIAFESNDLTDELVIANSALEGDKQSHQTHDSQPLPQLTI